MNNQKSVNNGKLSRASTSWFYIALAVATLFYIPLMVISVYAILFEPERGLFMYTMTLLAGANGFTAVILALRRKLYGVFWGFAPAIFVCLASVDMGYGSTFRSSEIVPMALLLCVPVILLLSQLPTLKKLKTLEPGWGLGALAYTSSTVLQASVWWFRIALTLSFLWYLLLFIAGCGFIINASPYSVIYPFYMVVIASANGLFAIYLMCGKEILGVFWAVASFISLGVCAAVLGLNIHADSTGMLISTALPTFLLLSQIPYLKKLQKIPGKGFHKTHFANGASFSDEELAHLYSAWSAYNRAAPMFIYKTEIELLPGDTVEYFIAGNGIRHDRTIIARSAD